MTSTFKTIWVPTHLKSMQTTRGRDRRRDLLQAAQHRLNGLYKLGIALIGVALPVAGWSLQEAQLDITKRQEAAKYISVYENKDDGLQKRWDALEREVKTVFDKYGAREVDRYDAKILKLLGVRISADNDGNAIIYFDEKNRYYREADEIVRHYRNVIRCVENRRCSAQSVEQFYKKDMCAFRRYFFRFVGIMSHKYDASNIRWSVKRWDPKRGDFYGFTETMCNPSIWQGLAGEFKLLLQSNAAHVSTKNRRLQVRKNGAAPKRVAPTTAFYERDSKPPGTRDARQEPKQRTQRRSKRLTALSRKS